MSYPTLADRNLNPGNLRASSSPSATQGEGGFVKFPNETEGYAALMNDIQAKISGNNSHGLSGNSTLYNMMSVYAPTADKNKPLDYTVALANSLGVRPDTKLSELQNRVPDLAQAIASHEGYTKAKGFKSSYNPKPFSNPSKGNEIFANNQSPVETPKKSEEQNYGQDLGGHLLDRTNDAANAVKDTMSGKINPVSGVLQTVGAAAGGLGDVINTSLEHAPVIGGIFKGLENMVSGVTNWAASTNIGKSVMDSVQSFSKEHPELANDIGAGFNIVTAVPILRGLGAIKNVAMDSVASSLKSLAVKGADSDIVKALSSTKPGLRWMSDNKSLIKKGLSDGIYPEISTESGIPRYTTSNASKLIDEKISNIYDKELMPAFNSVDKTQVSNMIPINTIKKEAERIAIENLENPQPLLREIEMLKAKYNSDYLTIDQVNEAKQIVARRISEAGFNNPTLNTDKMVRKLYQKTVEDMGEKLNLPNIHDINARMREYFKLLKIYDEGGLMDGKLVNRGQGLAQGVVKAIPGGETAMKLKNLVSPGNLKKGLQESILKRSATGYVKKPVVKKLGGLLGTALAQKQLSKKKK